MMGTKARSFAPLCNRSLEDLVPIDNFYRHLKAKLDLGFVRDLVRTTYKESGRPSIDPRVFFKLQLVMFFEGIRSERELVRISADRLSIRWYLGYDLEEDLPDHSSLTRIRQRYGLAAFRRSELVGLDVGDVQVTRDGLVVTIRRSKTDQLGEGQKIGVPRGRHAGTCTVKALAAWLELAGIDEGPIFRGVDRHGRVMPGRLTDRAVALIVQRVAAAAGLDPAQFAGHSLRAGLATSAAMAGAEEWDIMRQTRHKSVVVARRYIRDGSLFRNNAAGQVGL